MPLDPTQLKRALFRPIAAMLGALLLFAAAAGTHQVAGDIVGPLAIAVSADAQRIVVGSAGRIYHLDAKGALQGVDEEILDPDTREAGLAWLGDKLLVSPDSDGDLLRCSDTACELFTEDPYAPTGPVQVLVVDDRVWISEAGADRIQRYFADGRRIDMPLSDLSRPGSMWQENDQLYVANSGAQELQRYTVRKRGVDDPVKFAVFANGDERTPINRPTRFVRSGAGFRAIFSDGDREHAVLAAIDRDGRVTPLDVPDLVNPIALDALGDATLVVDENRMQVLLVAANGSATAFGDEDFRTQLADQQLLRAGLRVVVPVLLILGVLALAIGGSWLLRIRAAQEIDGPLPVKDGGDGILWLPRATDLAPGRMKQQIVIAAPAAVVPAIAAAAAGYMPAGIIWALLVFAGAAVGPLRYASRTRLPLNLRIGVRDRHLIVTDTERGMREYPLPQVAWDEFHLQPEADLSIPLVRDGVALFHLPTAEVVLMQHLNLVKRIGS